MNICVFCASTKPSSPSLNNFAYSLGQTIASKGHSLIYGGAEKGLMKEVKDGCKEKGGRIIGIIPQFLSNRGDSSYDCDEFIITKDMSERKDLLLTRGDCFIALPGGIGTLEELVQALSYNRSKLMDKPVLLYNPDGFYDGFKELLFKMLDNGFMKEEDLDKFCFVESMEEIESYL